MYRCCSFAHCFQGVLHLEEMSIRRENCDGSIIASHVVALKDARKGEAKRRGEGACCYGHCVAGAVCGGRA